MESDPVNPIDTTQDDADTLLVLRCQLGEPAALDALVRRWSEPLHRYATRLADDPGEAMDLAQDVWLRVLRGLVGLREPARFRAWMFGIAHRVFSDRLRARYAMPIADDAALDALPAGGTDPEQLELGRALVACISTLPLAEREATLLFHVEGLSLAEVAIALAVPVGTVKSRLFRARNLLRQRLVQEDTP